MFKWPDPAEGRIIVKTPFIIWWVGSAGLIILTFVAYIIFVSKPWKRKPPPGGSKSPAKPPPKSSKPTIDLSPPPPPGGGSDGRAVVRKRLRGRKPGERLDLEGGPPGEVTSEVFFPK